MAQSGNVPNERLGAVDGVDDPAEAARAGLIAEFLAEKAIVWEAAGDQRSG